MRRVLALTIALVLLAPTSALASTVKPGASCTRPGMSTVVNGTKYMCVIRKAKKVWNQGARLSNKNLPLTRNYYDQFGARGPVYRNMDDILYDFASKVSDSGIQSQVVSERAVDAWDYNILQQINSSSDHWRVLSPAFKNPTVVIAQTEPWLRQWSNQKCPSIYAGVMWGYGAMGCGTYVGVYAPQAKVAWDLQTTKIVGAHESFHSAQWQRSQFKNWNYIPNWFQEGSANVMGALSTAIETKSRHYDGFIGKENWDKTNCKAVLDMWLANQNNIEQALDHDRTNRCEYGLGRVMVEFLLTFNPNLPGLLDVYSDTGAGMRFSYSLRSNFGLTLPEFYAKLQRYLASIKW